MNRLQLITLHLNKFPTCLIVWLECSCCVKIDSSAAHGFRVTLFLKARPVAETARTDWHRSSGPIQTLHVGCLLDVVGWQLKMSPLPPW